MPKLALPVNIAVFYVAWFICVAWRLPWALPAAAFVIALHLLWVRPGAGEWRVLAACMVIGIVADGILTATGVFLFQAAERGPVFGTILPPLWLIALWPVFATTLNVSLKPLIGKPILSGILGAVMGPLSYWAGFKLGAVSFPLGAPVTLAILSPLWAVLFPVLLGMANRIAAVHGVSNAMKKDPQS